MSQRATAGNDKVIDIPESFKKGSKFSVRQETKVLWVSSGAVKLCNYVTGT